MADCLKNRSIWAISKIYQIHYNPIIDMHIDSHKRVYYRRIDPALRCCELTKVNTDIPPALPTTPSKKAYQQMVFTFQNQAKSEQNLLNWVKAVIPKSTPNNGYSAVITLIKTKGTPAPSSITDIWKAFS